MHSLDHSYSVAVAMEQNWLTNFNEKLEKLQDMLPCDPLVVYAVQADASRLLHICNRNNQRVTESVDAEASAHIASEIAGAHSRISSFVRGLRRSENFSPKIARELGI